MSPDDDDWKAKVEIIPPGEKSRELAARDKAGQLPEITLPPAGIIRSALITAVRYRSTVRALAAYHAAIREAAGVTEALDDLDYARLERERTIELLKDAPSIHKADADHRKKKLIKATDELEQEEARVEIARMERERKLHDEREKHRKWQQQQAGQPTSDPDDLSEEEQEFATKLKARSEKHRRSAQEPRLREIAEAIIEKIKQDYGGEKNLTPEAREHINRVEREAQQLIQDREPN